MDRTQRLFAVLDALRRHRHPVSAAQMAEAQGVSVRTLYRDVQTSIGLGAPIDGRVLPAAADVHDPRDMLPSTCPGAHAPRGMS
ncbi:HTH domain-containing protein [Nannocystis sp. bb15-2]|uniref:HTH domain-containing protein n=1 Tax=Nannocystis bainbridge TaxID=2995303 RepID=A0ABT5ED32_9BACT|nr:HTH domain-containing protein [Nannocystis bainbridge]